MASQKQHIVVVMGSFHIPWRWRFLKSSLEESGYGVTITNLASTVLSGSKPTENALAQDIAVIRSAVTKQIDQGQDIVVLAHSAGGMGTSGALEGLGKVG